LNGTQQSCQVAAATWSYGSCSVAGVCNKGPAFTDKASCEAQPGGQFAFATDVIRCIDADGRWTGNHTVRGQVITRLCMDCHRQETGGLPYDTTNPGTALKVGPAHGSVGFVSHPHGNWFLNSAHGKFSGTFTQIATAKLGSGYESDFMNHGEAANTGNGCTGCHDVHTSTVAGEEPFHEECMECHSNPADPSIPQVNIAAINHLSGVGTPLEHVTTKPNESCEICHMPGGEHLWRINTDAGYSTYPMPAALTTTVNANTAPDGTYANAVWVDINDACGQCHGGGSNHAATTGTTVANNKTVTVASTTGFLPGERVRILEAGSLYYDDQGTGKRADFDSYIVSIGAGSITLVGAPPISVSGKAVTQNPNNKGVAYRTKSQLAPVAVGMHASAPVNYPVTFSYTKSGLTVNVDAVVDCEGSCPTFTYDWNWGDGTMPHGTADPDTHTYAAGGSYSITLIVFLDGGIVDTVTRTVNLTGGDFPPVANAACTWNANTWTMTVVDASTDDGAPVSISVDWGDGTLKSFGTEGGTFNHQYLSVGTYTAVDKAIDSALQFSTYTCPVPATPAHFKITGTVTNSSLVPVPSASVQLLKGATVIKTVYTAANGTFTLANLKPYAYTIRVRKTGYTFPLTPATVGPDLLGIVITATAP
jgi:hypothetical protein